MPPCDWGAKDCTCRDCREMEETRSNEPNYEAELKKLYANERSIQVKIEGLLQMQKKNKKKIKENEKLLLLQIRDKS